MDDKHASPGLDEYGYKLAPEVDRRPPDDNSLEWHVATISGNRFGPWPLLELKRRVENGNLAPDDLVWRSGWLEWRAASTVPDLAPLFPNKGSGTPAPTGGIGPNPAPETPPVGANVNRAAAAAPATPAGFGSASGPQMPPALGPAAGTPPIGAEHPDTSLASAFGKPDFLRVAARISGCLAVFWFLISATAYFTSGFQWFTGMLIFFALFLLLEAFAVIIERQMAIGARLERLEKILRRRDGQNGD